MVHILEFLKPYVKRNLKDMIVFVIAIFASWAARTISPYLFGMYIDFLIDKADACKLAEFVVLIGLVNISEFIILYFGAMALTTVSNQLANQLRNDSCQHIFHSRWSIYRDIDKSYLVDQIRSDSLALTRFFSDKTVYTLLHFATVIVCSIIIFRADVILGALICILIPLYIFIYLILRKKIYAANLLYKKQSNEYYSRNAEQIYKLEFVKRHMLLPEMYERLKTAFQALYGVAIAQVKTNYFFSNLGQLMSAVCYICVLGLGGYRVFHNQLSVGYFTIINTYFTMIIASVSYFLDLPKAYQEARISTQRFETIYQADSELCGKTRMDTLNRIDVKSCSIAYDHVTPVFQKLSFAFEKGKIYGILGENGAGKTTLLNCLIGLYSDLFTGEILFDGIPVSEVDMPYLRRAEISLVEQFPDFLNLSIGEYLALGIDFDRHSEELQKKLIHEFQLDEFLTHTDINESGNNFSGGERQKLSIVRALSKHGFLTVLDEPTSALDNASVETLVHILQTQKSESITLIVTHDSRILNICDEIVHMQVG